MFFQTLRRPQPIMNFDLLELDLLYCSRMQTLLKKDPKRWSEYMNDWEHMALKENLKTGVDYCLVSLQNWMRLVSSFGGGPEIPLFPLSDGHDLRPIRVRIHPMQVMSNSLVRDGETNAVLVSRQSNQLTLTTQFGQMRPDYGSKVKMFVVHPKVQEMPVIYEVPKERQRLIQLGIGEMTDVVFISLEDSNVPVDPS